MSGICAARLDAEYKAWRKDRPVGFSGGPKRNANGTRNMHEWEIGIPGKAGTIWEGGVYKALLQFPADYPVKPPNVRFTPPLFHPNVYGGGDVCLSIIDEHGGWSAGITVKQVVRGVQELLDEPNVNSPAQLDAFTTYVKDRPAYERQVRAQAKEHTPADE
ncbi:SUMO conjugating enzyme Hus5 [Blastocladiella emersonii ATCC 22665]|nr:SUMO conjugating enzyme Hus5 [Blastocladiella emersonii ATCC 22665]